MTLWIGPTWVCSCAWTNAEIRPRCRNCGLPSPVKETPVSPYLFRARRNGGPHVVVSVFVGAEGRRALAGTLRFSEDEWHGFKYVADQFLAVEDVPEGLPVDGADPMGRTNVEVEVDGVVIGYHQENGTGGFEVFTPRHHHIGSARTAADAETLLKVQRA